MRELPAFLHPNAEQILDWFHVAMRIEQLAQTARGLRVSYEGLTTDTRLRELVRIPRWSAADSSASRAGVPRHAGPRVTGRWYCR